MKRFEKYYMWIVAFVFCIAVIAVYKTFDNLSHILNGIGVVLSAFKPFIIGFVIAYLLNIPATRIQLLLCKAKNNYLKTHSRGISILTVYLIAVIIFVLILGALIPALYKNIVDLYNNLPSYISTIENTLNNFEIVQKFNILGDKGIDLYAIATGMFNSVDMAQFSKYAQGVFNMTSGVLNMFISIVASVYMLLDKKKLTKGLLRIMSLFLKKTTVYSITVHARRINHIFTNYIYSRLICSAIMAIACAVVLTLLRVKYALILGLFVGVMDMIPYFGSIISSVISVLITFITGGLWKAIWSAVVLLVLQQLDGNLLGPKIMGDSLKISPLAIVLAVSVGGTLFGFLGMLLSVPVVAIIRAIVMEYIDEYEVKKKQTAEDTEISKD
jgi:predicted PurR-regulated permease PerM